MSLAVQNWQRPVDSDDCAVKTQPVNDPTISRNGQEVLDIMPKTMRVIIMMEV